MDSDLESDIGASQAEAGEVQGKTRFGCPLKFFGVLARAPFVIFRKCAVSQYFSFCIRIPAVYVCSKPSRGAHIYGEGGETCEVLFDFFRILCLFRFLREDFLLGMRSLILRNRKSS